MTVRVQPDEYLHREGDDLHAQAPVSMATAALGGPVTVQGLHGEVVVEVPAGAQHGDVVRVRGEGMPRLHNGATGDLIVHLAVIVPKKLNKRQRELLKELGESLGAKTGEPTPLKRIRDWVGG